MGINHAKPPCKNLSSCHSPVVHSQWLSWFPQSTAVLLRRSFLPFRDSYRNSILLAYVPAWFSSVIIVGIGCILAAATLLIHDTAKDTRSGLGKQSLYLLEILLIGAGSISENQRTFHLLCHKPSLR